LVAIAALSIFSSRLREFTLESRSQDRQLAILNATELGLVNAG
jgi:hypothetical protein